MGGGPAGFAAFAAVKYLGYTAFVWQAVRLPSLRSALAERVPRSPWLIGAARTGIGLAVGFAYGIASLYIAGDPIVFFALLLPIRFLEWGLLFRWFYRPTFLSTARDWKFAGLGTACSYVLDALAVTAAFVVPGGIWLC